MDAALSSRSDDMARAATRLSSIAAPHALVLLKASFSAPKLMHTMRASPCRGHAALDKFDGLHGDCVCSIINTDLADAQWTQAVRNGGLGVKRISSLAPSAFLASAAGTRDLQEMILFKCDATVDSAVDLVVDQCSVRCLSSNRPVCSQAARIGQALHSCGSSQPDVDST